MSEVTIIVKSYQSEDPERLVIDENGDRHMVGIQLSKLKEQATDDDIEVKDDFIGHIHKVSLSPWKDLDPLNTYLAFEFRYRDPKKIGSNLND